MAVVIRDVNVTYVVSPPGDTDPIAFERYWTFQSAGALISGTVSAATFRVEQVTDTGSKLVKELTLGTGMSWDDTNKVLHCSLNNSGLTFVRDNTDYNYFVIVVLDGILQTIRTGQFIATKVA